MKEKQSCAVIKDLLPLYMEGLTSDETNQVIKKHLEECDGCKRLYHSLQQEIAGEKGREEETNETVKEVDYLKKIRRNSRKKVWSAIGGAVLAVLLFAIIKIFVYGTPTQNYEATVSIEDDSIKIEGTFLDSASVYSHYRIVEKDGQKELIVYAAVTSFWNRNGEFEIACSLDEVKEQGLVVDDWKVTRSGNVVSLHAAEIYENRHSYIGDMPKNSALANAIGIGVDLGEFTNELQTAEEPYRWTIHFSAILETSNEAIFNEKMRGYAYMLLATVENADEISWTYMLKTEDGIKTEGVTLGTMEANRLLGEDIKSFADSEEKIEELLARVGLIRDSNGNPLLNGYNPLKEYKYRLTLTGRMPNAEKDSTFVVLTNNPNVTFEEVAKSLYSSNSADWLDDVVIVSME